MAYETNDWEKWLREACRMNHERCKCASPWREKLRIVCLERINDGKRRFFTWRKSHIVRINTVVEKMIRKNHIVRIKGGRDCSEESKRTNNLCKAWIRTNHDLIRIVCRMLWFAPCVEYRCTVVWRSVRVAYCTVILSTIHVCWAFTLVCVRVEIGGIAARPKCQQHPSFHSIHVKNIFVLRYWLRTCTADKKTAYTHAKGTRHAWREKQEASKKCLASL